MKFAEILLVALMSSAPTAAHGESSVGTGTISGFPVSIYEGATNITRQERQAPGLDEAVVKFRCVATPSEVMDFYKTQFAAKGWLAEPTFDKHLMSSPANDAKARYVIFRKKERSAEAPEAEHLYSLRIVPEKTKLNKQAHIEVTLVQGTGKPEIVEEIHLPHLIIKKSSQEQPKKTRLVGY
jgi:hypothetical protein